MFVIRYPHSALAAAGLVEHQSLRSNHGNMEWIGGEILLPQIERCNGVCSTTWQSSLMQADLWDCISTYASSVVETWVNPDEERCGCPFGFDLEFVFDYVISFYYFLSSYFSWFLTFISAYAYGVRSRDAGGYRCILRKKRVERKYKILSRLNLSLGGVLHLTCNLSLWGVLHLTCRWKKIIAKILPLYY
jgi:hypothetical protein